VASVASLRYDLAIPLPDAPKEGSAVLMLSLGVVSCVTLAVAVAVGFGGGWALPAIGAEALVPLWWTLPLGVAASGLYETLSYWGVRVQDYRRLARTKLSQGVGGAATQVGLGLAGLGPIGLIVGDIVGRGSGVLSLALLAGSPDRGARWPGWEAVAAAARRFSRFPMYSMPSSVLNSVGLYGPALVLAGIYGPAAAGWFALSQRVAGVGVALLGHAIGQAYLGEAALLARTDRAALRTLFRSIATKLFLVGFVIFIPLAVIAPQLVETVFGQEWRTSGDLLRVLTPFSICQLAVSPLSQTLNLLERQRTQLVWEVLRLVLGPVALVGCGLWGVALVPALAVYSVGMAVSYLVLLSISHAFIGAGQPPA